MVCYTVSKIIFYKEIFVSKWLSIDEFSSLTKLSSHDIEFYIKNGDIASKTNKDGSIFIKSTKRTRALIVADTQLINSNNTLNVDSTVVEKAIDTILDLHEENLESKDETIESLKSENEFLKDSVFSLQELYDESSETIKTLRASVEKLKSDAEFMSRKYKLMWNKAIENGDK